MVIARSESPPRSKKSILGAGQSQTQDVTPNARHAISIASVPTQLVAASASRPSPSALLLPVHCQQAAGISFELGKARNDGAT